MTGWRLMLMPSAEWACFRQLFGEMQLLYYRANRDLAPVHDDKARSEPR